MRLEGTTLDLNFAAVTAALYTALTLIAAPISFGNIQFRISEALCILPYFFPQAIPGLFIGCIFSNLFGGMGIFDIVFGSLATLLAAIFTYKIRVRWLACLTPALFNGPIIGAVLAFTLSPELPFWEIMPIYGAQVFIGEIGVLYIIGLPLMYYLPKTALYRKISGKLSQAQ